MDNEEAWTIAIAHGGSQPHYCSPSNSCHEKDVVQKIAIKRQYQPPGKQQIMEDGGRLEYHIRRLQGAFDRFEDDFNTFAHHFFEIALRHRTSTISEYLNRFDALRKHIEYAKYEFNRFENINKQ